jgi:hypothetical protein
MVQDARMRLATFRTSRREDDYEDEAGGDLRRRSAPHLHPTPEARRPMLAVAGVLVVVVCAAAGADVAIHVDRRQHYLAAAQYVAQGSLLVPNDLVVVSLAASSGIATIPASDSTSVLGRRASEPLAPGSLLSPSDLTAAVPLPKADALVGTSLGTNQAPAGLGTGDSVIVVLSGDNTGLEAAGSGSSSPSSPAAGSAGTAAAPSATAAGTELAVGTVYALEAAVNNASSGSTASELVTLEVPRSAAAIITAASAAGDVSLAEVPASAPASTSQP